MKTSAARASIRLPVDICARLDRAAVKTGRSRSFLIQRALERYLDEVERETPKRRLTTLLSLAGDGADSISPRSAEEIDVHLRWLRGN